MRPWCSWIDDDGGAVLCLGRTHLLQPLGLSLGVAAVGLVIGLVNGSSPDFSLSAVAAVLLDFGSATYMVKNTAGK